MSVERRGVRRSEWPEAGTNRRLRARSMIPNDTYVYDRSGTILRGRVEGSARVLGVSMLPPDVAIPPGRLAEYEGVYRIDEHDTRTVALRGGHLVSTRSRGEPLRLRPVGDDLFELEGFHTWMWFEREGGRVVAHRIMPNRQRPSGGRNATACLRGTSAFSANTASGWPSGGAFSSFVGTPSPTSVMCETSCSASNKARSLVSPQTSRLGIPSPW